MPVQLLGTYWKKNTIQISSKLAMNHIKPKIVTC